MMKNIILFTFLNIAYFHAQSQSVQPILYVQENNVFKLTYDLPNDFEHYDIVLMANHLTGKVFTKVKNHLSGDIGEDIPSGNNKIIYWKPNKEVIFDKNALKFKIIIIPVSIPNHAKPTDNKLITKDTDKNKKADSGEYIEQRVVIKNRIHLKTQVCMVELL